MERPNLETIQPTREQWVRALIDCGAKTIGGSGASYIEQQAALLAMREYRHKPEKADATDQ